MPDNGEYVPGSIYFYAPDKGAPVFFAVAFTVSGVYHIYQCIHFKSWRLTGLYVFCAAIFTAGFIVREMGAYDYQNLVKYIVSICLIYAAPPLLELANYNVLGRILYYVPHLSPIHPGRVITTFTFISGVVEALNGNGASYSANQSLPQSKQDMGRALLKAALLIQIVVIALFLLLAAVFHRRCIQAGIKSKNLKNALYTLYGSTALLTVRTIYRIVEYWSIADLHFGPGMDPNSLSLIIRQERYFYVFEAMLMVLNHYLMNVRHPRKYLPKSTKTYLDKNGRETTGPGYKDPRHFLVTILDPFDLVGLIKGRDKKTRFWDNDNAAGAPGVETNEQQAAASGNKKDPEA
ncbi:RTA1 like protein-domain-containing protein [Podospora didyma]|uniref:RTA1 like protein-domain-containing protein n=1 Tax=Podospora didyma TaxID=330526 RepID=A0AAE0TZ44_9PEZI|nr:RTA1 like protein-domain-containing protein [Podospora didyma]